MHLPRLTNGSLKQIHWAKRIRQNALDTVISLIGDPGKSENAMEFLNVDDATWWIMLETKRLVTREKVAELLGVEGPPQRPQMTPEEWLVLKKKIGLG